MNLGLHHGDLFDVLPTFPDNHFDSVVTDPPYDLTSNKKGGSGVASVDLDSPYGRARIGAGNGAGGFMGMKWDSTGVAFNVETWREVFRVMKPGAHLIAFGGTRTYHRMTVAIEDAGFEIRDSIAWLYGSGFPKSLDISKAMDKEAGATREVLSENPNLRPAHKKGAKGFDLGLGGESLDAMPITAPATDNAKKWAGWGTALKPAFEPIVVARKPFKGTIVGNVLTHGTGGLNIDACRIGETVETWPTSRSYSRKDTSSDSKGTQETGDVPNGRWPANVVIDEVAAAAIDEQTGVLMSGDKRPHMSANRGGYSGPMPEQSTFERDGDSGGASRFYYCAKPSREERDMGCYGLTAQETIRYSEQGQGPEPQQTPRKPVSQHNIHPTVKPVELMRWLVKLVTPVDGIVLDPFTGSGTTGMACAYEQRKFVGVEREAEYVEIAKRRIASVAPLFTDI